MRFGSVAMVAGSPSVGTKQFWALLTLVRAPWGRWLDTVDPETNKQAVSRLQKS